MAWGLVEERSFDDRSGTLMDSIVQRFHSEWGTTGQLMVSEAPYRVSPLGAHTDHQDGLVLGMTTTARLRIAFCRRDDGRALVRSREFEGEVAFELANPPSRSGDYGDYLRGIAVVLGETIPLTRGCHAWIEGDLKPGGVSSSAALAVAWLAVLLDLHGQDLPPRDRIRIVVESERRYSGVNIGLLDPSVILYGGPNKVVYLDCLDGVPKAYPWSKKCAPIDVLILDSGVERDLRQSPYNSRVEECRSVARAMGVPGDSPTLRSVGYEEFRRRRATLDPVAAKRADHVLSENKRVKHGLACLMQGDIVGFGALMNASGRSMVDFFGAGTPQTIELLKSLQEDPDVYGATLAGAGFGGSMLAFIRPQSSAAIAMRVKRSYAERFEQDVFKLTFTVAPLGGETKIDIA